MEASDLTSQLACAGVFHLVDKAVYDQLVIMLKQCLANSTALLQLEIKIKESVSLKQFQERIFLTLCAIFLTHTSEPQVQWISSLLLKNTLKDNVEALKAESTQELNAIKQALFITSMGKLGSEKLQEEFYMVMAGLIIKEFHLNDQDTGFFDEIIRVYQLSYNYNLLRIINDVIEDANDDRMWKFVPKILPATI